MDDPDPFRSTKGFRDWAGLPWGVLSEIFNRVGTVCLFVSAQLVCREWWRLAHEPRIWRRVHIKKLYGFRKCNIFNIGLAAVDRSAGCLEEFSAKNLHSTNVLLQRIAEGSTQLKVLRLKWCHRFTELTVIDGKLGYNVTLTEHKLLEACKSLPLLEVLDTSKCSLTEVAIESVGHSCPNLKAFHFDNCQTRGSQSNHVALAIAKNMCGLQKLEINRDRLDDDGLLAILDGCSHLEIIYLRNCCIFIGENLNYRVDKVKYYSYTLDKYVDFNMGNVYADFDYDD